MLFNSYEFLLVFFPIVFGGYFILGKMEKIRIRNVFLILMSLIFYGWLNLPYVLIICTCQLPEKLTLNRRRARSGLRESP